MEKQGIEMQFVNEWDGWDEHDCGVLYFTNVQLKHDVFPFPVQDGVWYDLLVDTQKCVVEVYAPDEQDEPVFTSKFKATLI